VSGIATGWLSSESATIGESTPVFGQNAASPKTVGALLELSRLFFLQTSAAAGDWLVQELASAIAFAVDTAVINGSGASGQPSGILNAGIGSQSGASLAWSGITAMMKSVENADAVRTPFSTGWAGAPGIAEKLRNRFIGVETPIWNNDRIGGRPAISSNSVPAGTLLFGDWSNVLIAEWAVLDIKVTESHNSNFSAGIRTVRALYPCDVIVFEPQSFCAATSIS
jgi:HK97 family phage major capsid protein